MKNGCCVPDTFLCVLVHASVCMCMTQGIQMWTSVKTTLSGRQSALGVTLTQNSWTTRQNTASVLPTLFFPGPCYPITRNQARQTDIDPCYCCMCYKIGMNRSWDRLMCPWIRWCLLPPRNDNFSLSNQSLTWECSNSKQQRSN